MLIENFKMALESLVAHKMRSFLTMLGIIIGISSVICIVSLGEGGKDSILGQFEKIGASTFNIIVDTTKAEKRDYITTDDIDNIRSHIDNVKYISPVVEKNGSISFGDKTKMAIMGGMNEEAIYINNIDILYGRFFNERDILNCNSVAVIDDMTARYLFGREDVVGEYINLGPTGSTKKTKVIGIMKGMVDTLEKPIPKEVEAQIPAIVYTPYTYMQKLYSTSDISSLYVIADTSDAMEEVNLNVINYLETKHRNREKDVYSTKSLMAQLDQINQVMSIFTTFIATVAAISLLVGGIGIMNILLVSVTERTREIGIRKAIGAKTKTILTQFLTEAVILSLLGGIIGLLLGVSSAYLLGSVVDITPTLSPLLVIGVLLFSSAIGLFFGIYPAKKAAKLDPIDALRYE